MEKCKGTKLFARAVCLALITVLVLSVSPLRTYAADGYRADNASTQTLEFFPSAGSTETQMRNNYGTIKMFYSSGYIENNRGTVEQSAGTIDQNNGTVKQLLAGQVKGNYGVIEDIQNTGKLVSNFENGIVYRNMETIEHNFGTVKENYGTVYMHGGTVEANGKAGTVILSGGGRQGTVSNNAGTVTVSDTGQTVLIHVTSNTGTIRIDNGYVQVTDNAGTIILDDKARLLCTNNTGTITKTESAVTYNADCTSNYGTVTFDSNSSGTKPTGRDYVKIVFSGDDGKAAINYCADTYNGVPYTFSGSRLAFTLPQGYVCTNPGVSRDIKIPELWTLWTTCSKADTEYTVFCHKCNFGAAYQYDENGHWKQCTICGENGASGRHNFENGVCADCGVNAFQFSTFRLVLSGELGMDFSGIVYDTEAVRDGYMLFEIGKSGEQKVYFADLTPDADGKYYFRCNLNVLQMADPITVSFHCGDHVVGPYTTSVATYIGDLAADDPSDTALVTLVKAIANYGYYAQLALQEVHGFTLGDDGKYQKMSKSDDITLPDAAQLAAYQVTVTGNVPSITAMSQSLALNHGTDILLFFTCEDGYTPTAAVTEKDGTAVDCTLALDESGKYLLTIPNISAQKLGDFYTVSVDGGEMTVQICALSYAYSVLSKPSYSEAQKHAAAALFEYYRSVIAYQAAHS